MFIYQADIWCDVCGADIRKAMEREGKAPEDTWDEASYDSDDYPKYGSDDNEADCPQHCAAGAQCLDFTEINGQRYGCFLANDLTSEGVEYVKEAFQRGGDVARFWADYYGLTVGCCGELAEDCECEE